MTTWSPTRARAFLILSGIVFLALFALPLFIDPYWWADKFGWDTGTDLGVYFAHGPKTDLGVYFGRCLGAVAVSLALIALLASREPARHRSIFTFIALATGLVGAVHLRGAIEDSQPAIEHAETALFALTCAVAVWCRPPVDAGGGP